MKANNLSISIPYKGCDKDCQYCVSKMTGYNKPNEDQFANNLLKAKNLAKLAGFSSVSITGKGEPVLNIEAIRDVCSVFSNYPLELQTNGLALKKDLSLIDELASMHIDIFAISMDKISDFEDMKKVIERIKSLGKIVRVAMNVTDMLSVPQYHNFYLYISLCKDYKVDQFSLRKITIANNTEETETHSWIEEHAENDYYDELINQFQANPNKQFIRSLPYGAKLYDVDGVSFTYFDYCIQDSSNGEDIRSLIYDEQGHLGTSWVSNAGRIF